jgi:DNA-binding transcriptional LysR family regulator
MLQELTERTSLDELAAFIAVAETGSFVKAGRRIGRDPSILSRRISQIENRLGVRLLSRTTRRVALTEAGSLYYGRVRSIVDELDTANLEASNFAGAPRGLLRIALPVTFGRLSIAPLLPGFLKKYPHIRIDARFADRHVDVVSEEYDVAIRVGMMRDSSLMARKIASFRYLLVASPEYVAERGQPTTPDELLEHSCLGFASYQSWPDWVLSNAGQRKTIRPAGPLVADNSEAVLHGAIEGIGVTLTPDWLAGSALRDGRLVEVLPGWTGPGEGGVYAVMPPGRLIPTKTRVFVDEIANAIKAGWADTGR